MQSPKIIKIIKDMLAKGASEQEIEKTLKDLGVSEKQIKSLLLIAEADTLNLIINETKKSAESLIDEKKAEMEKKIIKEIIPEANKAIEKNILELKNKLKKAENNFEQRINKEVSLMQDIIADLKKEMEIIKNDIKTIDKKIDSANIGKSKSILRVSGVIVSLLMLLIAVYKFFSLGFNTGIDYLIVFILFIASAVIIFALSIK